MIWSCGVLYCKLYQCVRRRDEDEELLRAPLQYIFLCCRRCIYCMYSMCCCIRSQPLVRYYNPTHRRSQPKRRRLWKCAAELISHSGREASESGPSVSYCKMKWLRSFVNVLIDLCPQTGKSGVVSRRLFSTPRDAFISCCWPALHPHYRAT